MAAVSYTNMGRYEIMDISTERLSLKDCPVAVSKYVINNDRLGDRLFLQLCFQNIGEKVIASVQVELSCGTEYSYSNLSAQPGASFGLDDMLPLPSREYKEIKVLCSKIVFDDSSVWDNLDRLYFE